MNYKAASFEFTLLYLLMVESNVKIAEFREKAEDDVPVPSHIIRAAKEARAKLIDLENRLVFGMHTNLFPAGDWDDEDELRY